MACGEVEVEVLFGVAPGEVRMATLALPVGATAADAVRASGLLAGLSDVEVDRLALACGGRICAGDRILSHRDRIEVLRPLSVDPKEARRLRHRRDSPTRKRASGMR